MVSQLNLKMAGLFTEDVGNLGKKCSNITRISTCIEFMCVCAANYIRIKSGSIYTPRERQTQAHLNIHIACKIEERGEGGLENNNINQMRV